MDYALQRLFSLYSLSRYLLGTLVVWRIGTSQVQKWIQQPQNRGDTMSVHVLGWDRYLVPGTRGADSPGTRQVPTGPDRGARRADALPLPKVAMHYTPIHASSTEPLVRAVSYDITSRGPMRLSGNDVEPPQQMD